MKQIKYLLAVSGGPDSMFLLDKYKNQNIVVATVNYNKRIDSNYDVSVVEKFCNKYKIHFELLDLKEHEKKSNNFQTDARIVRYEFFKKIYTQYNCSKLIVAHHKDDFLETALMQQRSNRKINYWGIKKQTKIFGMNVFRPFIDKYWKDEIQKKCIKKGIEFAKDYTNDQPVYERNKIRIELKNKSRIQKQTMINKFVFKNLLLKRKNHKIQKELKIWKDNFYSCNAKLLNTFKYKNELLYELINEKYQGINLTQGKIKSIWDFIYSKNGAKNYKLKDEIFLIKSHNCLVF
ncbi:tRNA lysidine(34) synthetase TilS [[Mycoplasma] gypis]|uniref:tRNA(Ile)-lysidine synthase n=1 Tax=[Mycoplasma] gypis TaxID=92404 RepID=A0ABZ2RMS2_9BACT|nr:tRNA lysidine(34) synthetase TilS [[Mycoplasma] gypis]MBN0919526.1 tRNA lysidine(34) synthetase TilS [[Mycoplasma] gypis]